jgi:hypothetical protein
MTAPDRKAWVVSVLMGLGHLRAAYPLRDIAEGGIIFYGSRSATPQAEYRTWRKMRRIYYFSSRAGRFPIIGQFLLKILLLFERIRPYYPKKDQSRPNAATRYLNRLVKKKGVCAALADRVRTRSLPVINTFYATAVALDDLRAVDEENYLLICDADFNRVWVPLKPKESRLQYLAPCTQVTKRLMAYGVSPENIHLTGFPLPKENIGSETGLEVLKEDLFNRLLRLDPGKKFFSIHARSVRHWLGRDGLSARRPSAFELTFAVGGAGAQVEIARAILKSLKPRILDGSIRLNLSAGVQKDVFVRLLGAINDENLYQSLEHGLTLIYDLDVFAYLDRFNRVLRRTDVLWTKPSELSFYCGLGIPILLAPPIGTHEELNRRWLREIHAGVDPAGPVSACHEWLFDLRENGRLAEAAWDGFLKSRKLGTYKIERLIRTGRMRDGELPLEK